MFFLSELVVWATVPHRISPEPFFGKGCRWRNRPFAKA